MEEWFVEAIFVVLLLFCIPLIYYTYQKEEREKKEEQEREEAEKQDLIRRVREKKEKAERETQEILRQEREKKEREEEQRKIFVNNRFYSIHKTKLDKLSNQYYLPTQRLIEALDGKHRESIFYLTTYYIEDKTHKIFAVDLLSSLYVEKDGFAKSYDDKHPTQDEKKVLTFVSALKEKVQNEWTEKETFPLAIYFITRYNFIRYKSEYYKSNYGFDNLTDLCKYSLDADEDLSLIVKLYTYYWIFEKNINLPLIDTYTRLYEKTKKVLCHIEAEKDKEKFFNATASLIDETLEDEYFDKENVKRSSTEQIDQMDGRSFEIFIETLFEKRGYKTTLTKSSGDYGIDVIIENEFVKIGIQTKCYTQKVGNGAIQEAVAGLNHYKLDKAMVITNNYFTSSAIELAEENKVILWDRSKLLQEIKNRPTERQGD